ncbi:MAG: type VI secretion system baseplate subunit TssF, partial [Chthoniobacterales bacterium]|nr:type VI secretion system baseplate subunit TssF [Chthoniobacterales bacterium]
MQREFLHFYNTELQHIREMAGEFAREYPKIASRLSLDREGKEVCPDPFVERLIEAFAFLSARVQLKLHSEFPRFTEALLETIFPTYLSPMPSMAIVSFVPNLSNKALAEGFVIPRGTTLPTITLREGLGQCLYRTAHTIKIWPITLREASYLDREAASLELPIRREGE